MLLSPEQEPNNIKVIHIAAAPVVGQHRHERKQQPHHAVLRSRPLLFSSCSSQRHHGINTFMRRGGEEAVLMRGSTCCR